MIKRVPDELLAEVAAGAGKVCGCVCLCYCTCGSDPYEGIDYYALQGDTYSDLGITSHGPKADYFD